jgi:hypothetical protein
MKAYRVKVSLKNNLLLSAIEAAGFKSIAEFERSAELRNGAVQGLVAMRDCPIGQTGEFGRVAKVCMEVLGAAPTDLWTPEQLMLKLRSNIGWRAVDMDIGQFQALARQQGEQMAALPSPEEVVIFVKENFELKAVLSADDQHKQLNLALSYLQQNDVEKAWKVLLAQ